MQRPTRCSWTAAEPAPATSSTATCARRGTAESGATGLSSGWPTPSHRTTVSAQPAGRPCTTAAWTRSSTEPAAEGWTTSARTAHAAQTGAKVSRIMPGMRVLAPCFACVGRIARHTPRASPQQNPSPPYPALPHTHPHHPHPPPGHGRHCMPACPPPAALDAYRDRKTSSATPNPSTQVTAATSGAMVLFSSSAALVQFTLLGKVNLPYAGVFGAASFVAGMVRRAAGRSCT
jgi:hypothetical protein